MHIPLPVLTIFGHVMTLAFYHLTSKSNLFIFVPKCTKVVKLVTFSQTVYEILC